MKLITKDIERRLRKAWGTGSNEIVVKFFAPWSAATWYITEGASHPTVRWDDDMIMFGLCDFGIGCPELGFVTLGELISIKGPFGLRIERDMYFSGKLSEKLAV